MFRSQSSKKHNMLGMCNPINDIISFTTIFIKTCNKKEDGYIEFLNISSKQTRKSREDSYDNPAKP